MKKLVIILFSISFLYGCGTSAKRSIIIRFENNSDLDTVLTIDTYLDGQNIKSTSVKRDLLNIYDTSVNISVKGVEKQKVELQFIIESTHDTASCIISPQQADRLGYIHVNFVKKVFEKGYLVFDKILDKDSVVHRDFYCELIDKSGVKM